MTSSPVEPGSATILVVDDAEASRYLTSSWLRRSGYRVTEATTGAAALDVLDRMVPDLVLLDVNLPDMNGFEVCELVKSSPRTAAVPVIHVSATAIDAENRTEGLTRGADGYLTEPIDPAELVATVESALRYYRARTAAERLVRRLTQLTELTVALNTAPSFDILLHRSASGAAAMFGGPVSVLTETPRGDVRMASTAGDGTDVVLWTRPAEFITGLSEADAEDNRPRVEVVEGLDWHPGGRATVITTRPMPTRSPVCVVVDAELLASEEDRNLLLQLGQATALACESLRSLNAEHHLALTLQRSLLPRNLPVNPALEMAARYVPASTHAEIGGDFYEVAELDGRVLIAVGDVTGHSIEAATVMGEVRHALRAYAVEGHDPVAILDHLDVMLRRFHPRDLTSLCLISVDLTTGVLEVTNAGHIPPLVVDSSGARYVPAVGPILGIGLPRPAATTVTVPPGAVVLLVTDGLVERRDSTIDDGMEALRVAVSHEESLEALCDRLLERFGERAQDDIALLAFRVSTSS